jgi:hypothetical protein
MLTAGPVPVARQDPYNDLDDEHPMDENALLDYADQEPVPFPTSTCKLGPMAQFLSRFPLPPSHTFPDSILPCHQVSCFQVPCPQALLQGSLLLGQLQTTSFCSIYPCASYRAACPCKGSSTAKAEGSTAKADGVVRAGRPQFDL